MPFSANLTKAKIKMLFTKKTCSRFKKMSLNLLHLHGEGKKSYLSSKGGMKLWKKSKPVGGKASNSKLMLSNWSYEATRPS